MISATAPAAIAGDTACGAPCLCESRVEDRTLVCVFLAAVSRILHWRANASTLLATGCASSAYAVGNNAMNERTSSGYCSGPCIVKGICRRARSMMCRILSISWRIECGVSVAARAVSTIATASRRVFSHGRRNNSVLTMNFANSSSAVCVGACDKTTAHNDSGK